MSLAQKQTELEELEQNVTDFHSDKQESQQRAALLQTIIDQLTEVRSTFMQTYPAETVGFKSLRPDRKLEFFFHLHLEIKIFDYFLVSNQ